MGPYEQVYQTKSPNEMETTATEQEIRQKSMFPEHNTQIFHMTLFNIKIINGTSSTPVTVFKESCCEQSSVQSFNQ